MFQWKNIYKIEQFKCFEIAVLYFDSNQKLKDPFFTKGWQNDLDVYYLSQSHFDLPQRTTLNNTNIILLFQQILKDAEHIYRDFAGFDMPYDEFKCLLREEWKKYLINTYQ